MFLNYLGHVEVKALLCAELELSSCRDFNSLCFACCRILYIYDCLTVCDYKDVDLGTFDLKVTGAIIYVYRHEVGFNSELLSLCLSILSFKEATAGSELNLVVFAFLEISCFCILFESTEVCLIDLNRCQALTECAYLTSALDTDVTCYFVGRSVCLDGNKTDCTGDTHGLFLVHSVDEIRSNTCCDKNDSDDSNDEDHLFLLLTFVNRSLQISYIIHNNSLQLINEKNHIKQIYFNFFPFHIQGHYIYKH